MDNRDYYVLLSMIAGFGPRRLKALSEIIGNPEKIWCASENQLLAVPGIPSKVITGFLEKRKYLDPQKEMEKLAEAGIKALFIDDPAYPAKLRQIYDPPKVLYLRGKAAILQNPMFAIVGARKASHYGLSVAASLAGDLAEAGLCVVSGMARGIDTAAHKGALSVSGLTVAVLGCGVNIIYPPENKKLMEDIVDQGAVISEFPPGTAPAAGNFPQRNRIISGLSEGVMVVEAAEKSGSLITADFALEQGREVFAVPGQITNTLNTGAHRLIKQGAKLVEGPQDILEELNLGLVYTGRVEKPVSQELTAGEKKIYNNILDVPVSGDELVEKSGMHPAEAISHLSMMEIKGLIRQISGQLYVRC